GLPAAQRRGTGRERDRDRDGLHGRQRQDSLLARGARAARTAGRTMRPEDEEAAADRAFEQRAAAELARSIDATPRATRKRRARIVDRALYEPPRSRRRYFALPAGVAAAIVLF